MVTTAKWKKKQKQKLVSEHELKCKCIFRIYLHAHADQQYYQKIIHRHRALVYWTRTTEQFFLFVLRFQVVTCSHDVHKFNMIFAFRFVLSRWRCFTNLIIFHRLDKMDTNFCIFVLFRRTIDLLFSTFDHYAVDFQMYFNRLSTWFRNSRFVWCIRYIWHELFCAKLKIWIGNCSLTGFLWMSINWPKMPQKQQNIKLRACKWHKHTTKSEPICVYLFLIPLEFLLSDLLRESECEMHNVAVIWLRSLQSTQMVIRKQFSWITLSNVCRQNNTIRDYRVFLPDKSHWVFSLFCSLSQSFSSPLRSHNRKK